MNRSPRGVHHLGVGGDLLNEHVLLPRVPRAECCLVEVVIVDNVLARKLVVLGQFQFFRPIKAFTHSLLSDLVRCAVRCSTSHRYVTVRYGMIRHGMVRNGTLQYGITWYVSFFRRDVVLLVVM